MNTAKRSTNKEMVYEPQEDSFLLQKFVARRAKGTVLDVGTGSGIQALTAARKKSVKKVLAVDVDKNAIAYCKRNSRHPKIAYKVSDLFSKVPMQEFDTVIFNPPYLPQDHSARDVALEGGKRGYETLGTFFRQASSYLKPNGQILVVFSSFTNKNKVDEAVRKHLLEFKQLATQHIFFEDLYVYAITKTTQLKRLERRDLRNPAYLAKGKRGIVYTADYKRKKVAIKVKRKEYYRVRNEGRALRIVNKHKIGPKLLFSSKDYLVYEFIDGPYLKDWLPSATKTAAKRILKQGLEQCYTMDKLGISKEEMHRPLKNAIVRRNQLVLIDFERAHKTKKSHNVTQFCQFIMNWKSVLAKKGIKIHMRELQKLAADYKANPSRKTFGRILRSIA